MRDLKNANHKFCAWRTVRGLSKGLGGCAPFAGLFHQNEKAPANWKKDFHTIRPPNFPRALNCNSRSKLIFCYSYSGRWPFQGLFNGTTLRPSFWKFLFTNINAQIFDRNKRKECGAVPGQVRTFFNKVIELTYIRAADTLALVFSPPWVRSFFDGASSCPHPGNIKELHVFIKRIGSPDWIFFLKAYTYT